MSATVSSCFLAQELSSVWAKHFAHLDAAEHRGNSLRHKLSEVCFAYYISILCGHRTYQEASDWMSAHSLAFARMFASGHWHRPPHANTLSRLLRGMAPGTLEALLGAGLKGQGSAKHLAMDGKCDRSDGQMYLTVYQPWTGKVLGQLPFEIGQEIAAFEKALGELRKGGKFKVTGDAIHSQIATFQEAKKRHPPADQPQGQQSDPSRRRQIGVRLGRRQPQAAAGLGSSKPRRTRRSAGAIRKPGNA